MLRNFLVIAACITITALPSHTKPTQGHTMFTLTSPSITPGQMIPDEFTCTAGNNEIFPGVAWNNAPKGTVSFVYIMEDFDVPKTRKPDGYWLHGVMFNIPASTTMLEEGDGTPPEGAVYGENSWEHNDFGGPCPSDRQHDYHFTVYALDTKLNLSEGASLKDIKSAMEGHILDKASFVAPYDKPERRRS